MGSDPDLLADRARSTDAPWLVRMTSPVQCVLAFAAGAGLQHALGLPVPQGAGREAMQVVGTVLANAGLLLVLWCFALSARARTTLLPAGAPARLLQHGPFRWSRNPIYVGLLASYVGLALMLGVPWALVLLPAPVWILQRKLVPWEEAGLHERFADSYAEYARRVRRWL
jgi:protein-S-isoprenylcysteine O-methyltransferase Ste14